MTAMEGFGALRKFIDELRADLSTMPNLRKPYFGVPDSVNSTPALVVYPLSGRYSLASHSAEDGSKTLRGHHTVRAELVVARKHMDSDEQLLEQFYDVMPQWIYEGFLRDRYGDSILSTGDPRTSQNSANPVRYRWIPSIYGTDEFIGLQFEIDVTIEQRIGVPAT